jgi:hypothetical protein
MALGVEAFSPVLAVAQLPGDAAPRAFVETATAFCNDKVLGTLSATVIVHPSLEKVR